MTGKGIPNGEIANRCDKNDAVENTNHLATSGEKSSVKYPANNNKSVNKTCDSEKSSSNAASSESDEIMIITERNTRKSKAVDLVIKSIYPLINPNPLHNSHQQ